MNIIPKPQHMSICDANTSPKAMLLAVAALICDGHSVAVVVSDNNGQFHTYQHGCDQYELACCAEALHEWARNYDADVVIAKSN